VQQHRLSAGSRVATGSNVVLAHILDEGRERQVKRREAALWCSTEARGPAH
jgi:16S rRNA U516 pseudouridylate synthase RsuA-like enzyme